MTTTRYIRVDARKPEAEFIEVGAELIRAGELVAFPTETVYGLGADAFQPGAVEKIFRAKGRPPENALLVHVSSMDQVQRLVAEIPVSARKLMEHFWPGPLSIILPSRSCVPEIVRGGSIGVGLRMPSHPVALALIERTGPLAAPSANLYGRPSPTNAKHVRQDMDGKIAAVLDGGDTGAGLESTLIDLSAGTPRILRRGGTSVELIEEFLELKIEIEGTESLPRYQTKVKVVLSDNQANFGAKLEDLCSQGVVFGVVHINNTSIHRIENVNWIYKLNLSGLGMSLYSILRDAEENGLETLLFTPVDPDQARAAPAMMDRLRRAASDPKEEQ
ncbi:MAG: threonylcarbamoyl-AMP synthase [Firmicutes bacterium HGW-Firmicutes-15]|nr:MAG: threonylcarbamoyl-AMP synthase [Firmicutes bacterium HGW-Firmicutes-15]